MSIDSVFEKFALAFEAAVHDDNWSRLGKYLTDDATYLNIGGSDSKCEGRAAIIAHLKADVSNFDQKFDVRNLIALSSPVINDNQLTRQWRCTYTLAGTPELIVEGEARYVFEGELIKAIEEIPNPDSIREIEVWMEKYADKLGA